MNSSIPNYLIHQSIIFLVICCTFLTENDSIHPVGSYLIRQHLLYEANMSDMEWTKWNDRLACYQARHMHDDWVQGCPQNGLVARGRMRGPGDRMHSMASCCLSCQCPHGDRGNSRWYMHSGVPPWDLWGLRSASEGLPYWNRLMPSHRPWKQYHIWLLQQECLINVIIHGSKNTPISDRYRYIAEGPRNISIFISQKCRIITIINICGVLLFLLFLFLGEWEYTMLMFA